MVLCQESVCLGSWGRSARDHKQRTALSPPKKHTQNTIRTAAHIDVFCHGRALPVVPCVVVGAAPPPVAASAPPRMRRPASRISRRKRAAAAWPRAKRTRHASAPAGADCDASSSGGRLRETSKVWAAPPRGPPALVLVRGSSRSRLTLSGVLFCRWLAGWGEGDVWCWCWCKRV